MSRLAARIRHRDEIGPDAVGRMYALYAAYYAGTSAEQFAADLCTKEYVIELLADGGLRGFSTLAVMPFQAGGAARRALYSGDTIIDHRYWGEQVLATSFCGFAGSLKAVEPHTPLYWFLITKGHRTYRYLGAFAREYYPHPKRQTPLLAAECIDVLARTKFGVAWKPNLGIVRFEPAQAYLRPEWVEPRPALARRAEVRYFLHRNPGHARGDELCCLAELTVANLRGAARRAFLQGHDDASRLLPNDRRPRAALSPRAGLGAPGAAAAPALDSHG